MLGLLPVVAASGTFKKPDEVIWKRTVEEADKLYNDHSYQKLHDYLLQFKVYKLSLSIKKISI